MGGRRRKRPYTKFHAHNPKHSDNSCENIVYEALEILVSQNKLDFFIHAERFDDLDSAHIDFLLCKRKKLFALQIKGTEESAEKHKKRYPLVPVLWVKSVDTEEKMKRLVKTLFKIFHREPISHETILDEKTIDVMRAFIQKRGFLSLSPFRSE